MHRRLAPWFGLFVLGLVASFLAIFGLEALTEPLIALGVSGLIGAGVLSIIGGTWSSVSVGPYTIPWNTLLGAADGVLAVSIMATGLQTVVTDGGTTSLLFGGAAIVSGASLGWFGLQTARDSRHVDLEATPSRTRLAGIALLASGSLGIGLVVALAV